jgi:hypothetical protein
MDAARKSSVQAEVQDNENYLAQYRETSNTYKSFEKSRQERDSGASGLAVMLPAPTAVDKLNIRGTLADQQVSVYQTELDQINKEMEGIGTKPGRATELEKQIAEIKARRDSVLTDVATMDAQGTSFYDASEYVWKGGWAGYKGRKEKSRDQMLGIAGGYDWQLNPLEKELSGIKSMDGWKDLENRRNFVTSQLDASKVEQTTARSSELMRQAQMQDRYTNSLGMADSISKASAVGVNEGEKFTSRMDFLGKSVKQQTWAGNIAQQAGQTGDAENSRLTALKHSSDLYEGMINAQRRVVELVGEEANLRKQIQRDNARSLMGAGSGEILRKLVVARRMAQGGPMGAGEFFAGGEGVRNEMLNHTEQFNTQLNDMRNSRGAYQKWLDSNAKTPAQREALEKSGIEARKELGKGLSGGWSAFDTGMQAATLTVGKFDKALSAIADKLLALGVGKSIPNPRNPTV